MASGELDYLNAGPTAATAIIRLCLTTLLSFRTIVLTQWEEIDEKGVGRRIAIGKGSRSRGPLFHSCVFTPSRLWFYTCDRRASALRSGRESVSPLGKLSFQGRTSDGGVRAVCFFLIAK